MAPESSDVALVHEGRRVLLKWHKLRRRAGDPPFSMENLRDGIRLGASLEIDARLLSDGTWVCLHDDVLDDETTGKGPVAASNLQTIKGLRVTGASYPPPLLADVVAAIGREGRSEGCVQIDLKEAGTTLTAQGVKNFAELVGPVAGSCLLSGTDWPAVERLAVAVPGLRLGYDPYDLAEGTSFPDAKAVASFMDEVLAIVPGAATFYLYHRFVAQALDLGGDPIAPLKRNGATVDVWTLDPGTPDIEAILLRMIEAGADQITTNDPPGMARVWEAIR